ncbi:glycosyltransferase [Flexithrix dorotheae]|uniref:glycosyltransferase n=1 Tax=Flexithrix dorotheae TaxID=70993 RepID=UPI00035C4BC1|nr:glycosyltransferase [Flexithrix dorotheae]
MKAIFFALGSRGDIEPLFSLGESLKKNDWEVIYVFPEQFKEMVKESGDKFYGFTKAFIEVLLASEKSKIITSQKGSGISRIKTLFSLAFKSIRINKEITIKQKEIIDLENPDFVFFNQKCVYPIVWGIKNPNKVIFVHPFPCFLHPVDTHSIIGFSGGGNYGKFLNRLSYNFQSFILSIATYFTTRKLLRKDDAFKTNPFEIRKYVLHKIRSIYTISPSFFQQPNKWGDHVDVIGFAERDKCKEWKPKKLLADFLEKYKEQKIFFITFGSISNPNPEAKTRAILKVLGKHKVPTIINTSWGGLVEVKNNPEHIIYVNDIPYDWIFPKVYGVVHHGGSGTTHSAIKYGCSSLIIPHFIDQFFWSKTIVELKLGPKGHAIQKLSESNFEKSFLDLMNNEVYKKNAENISVEMKHEFDIHKLMSKLKNIS